MARIGGLILHVMEQNPSDPTIMDAEIDATAPHPGQRAALAVDTPMPLDCGVSLGPFTLAYQTYGQVNQARSNAILICHALTGDQFVADPHPVTGKPGWWSMLVGPGRVIDTDRYFVICANVIGGCMGSTGPAEIDPATGEPYGLNFPVITIADMVRAQKLLIDHLCIDSLFAVIGGSMGAMQALQWAVSYPDRVFACIPIAGSWRHSAQNIAFHEVGRQAIIADPNWQGGAYYSTGNRPTRGLAVARMAAHITYLSEAALTRKFGRSLQDRLAITYGFEADFQVESYLRHQGITFVDRFDANSYLYITRAMDYFDLAAENGGSLANAFRATPVRFGLVSFTSDWLFPTSESRDIVKTLLQVDADVGFAEIETDKGHDAFLLDEPAFHDAMRGFLDGWAALRGLQPARIGADEAVPPTSDAPSLRVDLQAIAELVPERARVLDVGCGDGALLSRLMRTKGIEAHGLEVDLEEVHAALSRGLPVVQGDANNDLDNYADKSFDYVILSKTIQQLDNPVEALTNLLRIGHHVIVSLNNFGFYEARLSMVVRGRMPVTRALPARWHETPNTHLCTLQDFVDLIAELGCRLERIITVGGGGRRRIADRLGPLDNLLAEQAVFLISRD